VTRAEGSEARALTAYGEVPGPVLVSECPACDGTGFYDEPLFERDTAGFPVLVDPGRPCVECGGDGFVGEAR